MNALLRKLEREKAARKRLLDDVMQTRQQQVAARLQAVELEKLEAAKEHRDLVEAIRAQEEAEDRRRAEERERAVRAAEALKRQARDNAQRRAQEEAQREEEARYVHACVCVCVWEGVRACVCV